MEPLRSVSAYVWLFVFNSQQHVTSYKGNSKTYEPDWKDVLSGPEPKHAIIISAVSNIISVTLQGQGQQTVLWNVPCELHSMQCTAKYTVRETEMSFFEVTGASRKQIRCLTAGWRLRDRSGATSVFNSKTERCLSKPICILDLAKAWKHGLLKGWKGGSFLCLPGRQFEMEEHCSTVFC